MAASRAVAAAVPKQAQAQPRQMVPAAEAVKQVFAILRALPELTAGEKLAKNYSGLHEMAFLVLVLNKTFALSREKGTPAPLEVRLSHSAIARAIGVKSDPTSLYSDSNPSTVVQKMVKRLRDAGIIAARREGKDQVYWYKLTPARWADAPKWVAPKGKLLEMPAPAEEPEEEEADEDPQEPLPGLEHIALATSQARSFAIDTTKVSFLNELPLAVGIHHRIVAGVTRFILREEGKGVKLATSDQPVGGHNSSHAVMAEELMAQMAQRKFPIAPDFARHAMSSMGWPDVNFVLEKVDDSIARCKANHTRFLPAWLKTSLAKDIRHMWPAEKQQRARNGGYPPGHCCNCGAPPDRRSTTGERCRVCGERFDAKA